MWQALALVTHSLTASAACRHMPACAVSEARSRNCQSTAFFGRDQRVEHICHSLKLSRRPHSSGSKPPPTMTDQRTIPQRPMGTQGFVTSQQGLGCMGEHQHCISAKGLCFAEGQSVPLNEMTHAGAIGHIFCNDVRAC